MKQVVKCLIKSLDGQILLLKRAKSDSHAGYWETCGGGVDNEDSSFLDAMIREIKEETDLTVTYADLKFNSSKIMTDDESGDEYLVHLFECVYLGELSDANVESNDDHEDVKWVDIKHLKAFTIDSWTLDQLNS